VDPRAVGDRIERVEALDAVAKPVSSAVGRALPAGALKDALSGTFLGHPLHPLLTDLPIGFWTSAWTLDIVGGRGSRDAARRLVGLGVLSALPTAATGVSDWADTVGGPRRVGVVHAAANSVALAAYAASWVARRRGRYGRGVALGMVGAAAATVGGYLGGHLSFSRGIGVDNTAFDEDRGVAADWAPLSTVARDVFVVGDDAIAERCNHRGGPLHDGTIDADGCVTCPWHGSRFRLSDGSLVRGPATRPQPRYEVRRTVSGEVEVRRARP
jgi:nitrite reductase/ring-hydroxylating ferredoxin subunit/uncharacterized membrane protein